MGISRGGDVLFSKTVRRSELYKEGDGGSRGEDVLFLVNTGEKLRTSRDNLISACCIRNQQVDYFPKQLGILRFAFQLVGTSADSDCAHKLMLTASLTACSVAAS